MVGPAHWNDDRKSQDSFLLDSHLKGFHSFIGAASILKLPSLESWMFLECSLHLCDTEFNTDLPGSDPDDFFTQFNNLSIITLSREIGLA